MKCNARRSLVAPKFNWPDSRFGYLSSPAKVESSKCLKAPITLSLPREYPCSYDFHVFVFFILHFFTITYSKNQCSFFFFFAEKNQCFQKLFSSYFIYNFFFFWSKCVEVHKQNLVWWSVFKKTKLKNSYSNLLWKCQNENIFQVFFRFWILCLLGYCLDLVDNLNGIKPNLLFSQLWIWIWIWFLVNYTTTTNHLY